MLKNGNSSAIKQYLAGSGQFFAENGIMKIIWPASYILGRNTNRFTVFKGRYYYSYLKIFINNGLFLI
ncbi:MAG TPA: hypothetical protein DDW53_06625 [Lachnoclostridium sp.]|nr:hypothetical protein [Lachnoclostridium sp.]